MMEASRQPSTSWRSSSTPIGGFALPAPLAELQMTNERLQSLFTLPMDEQLRLFGDMSTLYPTRLVRRGRSVSGLLTGEPIDLLYRARGDARDIDGFMQRYRAAGLLILKRG